MRKIKILFVALGLAAGLGLPAGAAAQNAGDDQYADPFEETPSAQTAPATPSGDDNASEPAAATPVGETTAAPTATTAGTEQLPHTGLNLVLLLVTGAVLLLSGFTVRRVLTGPYAAAR